ncbi:MAG: Inositol 2-dehydrogenase/D-chiro-inositol 3-dehydrogenase [Gemmatimonadaceae bacterium]|nr:Inositol 2-dehydrogenase/D-chiro-inositol 3-dehydrogenase [Gemmatimonadaceae bacterium]
MTERQIRWGVLSTANIGRHRVNPAIQSSRNGTLCAVASRDAGRARDFARDMRIPRHYGSYDALLADTDIDAVYIPLPNSMHRDWSRRAAEHGKHVLCEKPLALNAAECREMRVAASSNGTLLMEAFMYRFHPRSERLVHIARSGALGELRAIRSAFTFQLTRPGNIRLVPELGGGALMDVGCYCVNASRTIAGCEPLSVQAVATWGPTGVDMELTGMLVFPGGLVSHFDCSLTGDRREVVEVGVQLGVPRWNRRSSPVTVRLSWRSGMAARSRRTLCPVPTLTD